MNQEALESQHSRSGQGLDVILIIFDHAAPRRPIDPALSPRCFTFCLEGGNVGRRRQAVERHIDQHGVATRRGSASRGAETFPIRPARLVDVEMRIHQPGKDRRVAKVMRFDSDGSLLWAKPLPGFVRLPRESRRAGLLPR